MGERLVGVGYDIYFSTFPGNDFLNRYSSQVSSGSVDMLIEMTDWSDVQKDVIYKECTFGDSSRDYEIKYGGFEGGTLSMINNTYDYKTKDSNIN